MSVEWVSPPVKVNNIFEAFILREESSGRYRRPCRSQFLAGGDA